MYISDENGAEGWKFSRLNDSFDETDLSSTVLPSSLRSTDDGGTFAGVTERQRMSILVDMQTDPTTPKVFIYHASEANSEGDSFSVYEYIDDSTEMTSPVDTGGDSFSHAIPTGNGQHMGGCRFWTNTTAGQLDALIMDATEGADDIVLDYHAFNDDGGNRTLTVYFSKNGSGILAQASLSAATGGSSTLSGNTVITVDPDDGTTDYTVTVDYGLSGIEDGDRVQYYLQLA